MDVRGNLAITLTAIGAFACGKDSGSAGGGAAGGSGDASAQTPAVDPKGRTAFSARLDVKAGGRAYADAGYVFCVTSEAGLFAVLLHFSNRSAEWVDALLHGPVLSYQRTPPPGKAAFAMDIMQFASSDYVATLGRAPNSPDVKARLKEAIVQPGETKDFVLTYGPEHLLGCEDSSCKARYPQLWSWVLRDVQADDAAVYTEQGLARAFIKPGGKESAMTLYFDDLKPTDPSACPPPPGR